MGAAVNCNQHQLYDETRIAEDIQRLDELDHALAALEEQMEQEDQSTLQSEKLSEMYVHDLACKKIGISQCNNLCEAKPHEQVQKCRAQCYAACHPKNSLIKKEEFEGDHFRPSCKRHGIEISIFKDKECKEEIVDASEQANKDFKEAMKEKGSCKKGDGFSSRYLCSTQDIRQTFWEDGYHDSNCETDAAETYVYQWKKCIEKGDGTYILFKGARALKTAVVGATLALISS